MFIGVHYFEGPLQPEELEMIPGIYAVFCAKKLCHIGETDDIYTEFNECLNSEIDCCDAGEEPTFYIHYTRSDKAKRLEVVKQLIIAEKPNCMCIALKE